MSGICGLLRLDGGPPEGLAAMAALLERRGPEGTHLWQDGPVALGHTLLATTPEALHEVLPFTDPATGCTITADARLDNRAELLDALGLAAAGRVVGDGEVLLRAWLAWGAGCLDRLLGDYAFAVWDPRTRQLFAARDPMGMRQLLYAHLPGRLFAFATEARAVLAAPGVPRRIDEGRIADFLDDHESSDFTSTFFQGVLRLPPAHALSVGPSGLTLRRYWSPLPEPELRLGSDQAYADAFLAVFTEAVRCRLRGAGPVGSMLSGGMDSGSVVAVASRLLAAEGRGPLPTFSAVGPDLQGCVETRAIHAALTQPNLDPHLVNWADLDPWREDLLAHLAGIDEPFDGLMNLPRAVYLAARREGVKVMLDGGAGDVVVSRESHIGWLLRAGRWTAAWKEALGEERFYGGWSRWDALRHAAVIAFAPPAIRRLRLRWKAARQDAGGWVGALPGLARRSDLPARRRIAHDEIRRPRTPWEDRVDGVTSTSIVAGRERYDRVAGALGIEPRDPFLDLRVVRFALRLPMDQLQADGWRKVVLRRAMRGLLPDEVIWRRGKEHLGATFTQQLLFDPARPVLAEGVAPLLGLRAKAGPGPSPSDAAETLHNHLISFINPLDQLYLACWLGDKGRLDEEPGAVVRSWG